MPIIWIVCPDTGHQASTGIETDPESFAALQHFALTLTCPDCGKVHPWTEMSGHLVDMPHDGLH